MGHGSFMKKTELEDELKKVLNLVGLYHWGGMGRLKAGMCSLYHA